MKLLRILVGTVSGAIWTGLLAAGFMWVIAYTDSRSWYLGPIRNWAPMFAYVGGLFGLGAGLALGFVISLVNRGKGFGAFVGAAVGLIAVIWFGVVDAPPEWDMRSFLSVMAFLPLGAVSGLLTAINDGNRSFLEQRKTGEASSVPMKRAQNKALQLTAR